MGSKFQSAAHNVASNHGDIPILKLILGIVLLYFFVLVLLMDIQASESFLLQGGVVSAPDWGILQQPLQFAHGQLPAQMAKAVVWGWGIELVYLMCVVGEVAVHGRLGGIFKTGAFILVCVNFWTNINYGTLPSGMGGQVSFALITAFVVAFFGVVGLRLVFGAVADLTHF